MAKVRTREDIIKCLQDHYPQDCGIQEIADIIKVYRNIVDAYLKMLAAEGKIVMTRVIGRNIMYPISQEKF